MCSLKTEAISFPTPCPHYIRTSWLVSHCVFADDFTPPESRSRESGGGADMMSVLSQGNHISSNLILGHFPQFPTNVFASLRIKPYLFPTTSLIISPETDHFNPQNFNFQPGASCFHERRAVAPCRPRSPRTRKLIRRSLSATAPRPRHRNQISTSCNYPQKSISSSARSSSTPMRCLSNTPIAISTIWSTPASGSR